MKQNSVHVASSSHCSPLDSLTMRVVNPGPSSAVVPVVDPPSDVAADIDVVGVLVVDVSVSVAVDVDVDVDADAAADVPDDVWPSSAAPASIAGPHPMASSALRCRRTPRRRSP